MSRTSDSFETFYKFEKINEKDPLVFIHGVGLNNEIWEPQASFFKNYNILTYDLPGHGKTPLKKTRLNFNDYSKQLLKLMQLFNLPYLFMPSIF